MDTSTGGFVSVTPYEEARTLVRSLAESHGRVAEMSLDAACGRVAATAPEAPRAVPHYERAATDGFAVQAEDTFEASERSPVRLSHATGSVSDGQAISVQRGEAIPEGADAVVSVAHTERRDGGLDVFGAVSVGENLESVGSDVAAGQRLLEDGTRLGPQEIAGLRGAGIDSIRVYERSRVVIIPFGDALVADTPESGEMRETNGEMVASLVEQWGGTATVQDVAADEAAVRTAFGESLGADVVVTTGGSAIGTDDVVPGVVDAMGDLHVHGVTLEPGHSLGLGAIDGTPVVVLPGTPVSASLDAVQFLRPLVALVGSTTPGPLPTVRARLDGKLASEPGTRTFTQIALEETDTGLQASPAGTRANTLSSGLSGDGWVEIPEHREGIPAGETVAVQQWDWTARC